MQINENCFILSIYYISVMETVTLKNNDHTQSRKCVYLIKSKFRISVANLFCKNAQFWRRNDRLRVILVIQCF